MKAFQQKTKIQTFKTAKEFVEEYQICESDFILASRTHDIDFKDSFLVRMIN